MITNLHQLPRRLREEVRNATDMGLPLKELAIVEGGLYMSAAACAALGCAAIAQGSTTLDEMNAFAEANWKGDFRLSVEEKRRVALIHYFAGTPLVSAGGRILEMVEAMPADSVEWHGEEPAIRPEGYIAVLRWVAEHGPAELREVSLEMIPLTRAAQQGFENNRAQN